MPSTAKPPTPSACQLQTTSNRAPNGVGDGELCGPIPQRADVKVEQGGPRAPQMTTVSRDQLHRTVEELPEERLTAAAELLEALAAHDQHVHAWRQTLSPADEAEIATSP